MRRGVGSHGVHDTGAVAKRVFADVAAPRSGTKASGLKALPPQPGLRATARCPAPACKALVGGPSGPTLSDQPTGINHLAPSPDPVGTFAPSFFRMAASTPPRPEPDP
ncbi:translation initiation factor IF-2-like protein [Lysobacter enzymogenes]|uniref:Translation initiation factor IF-2-like protein n=1 Tax=Lysobacter enzymogenes TaxID=69 RepID=A0A0S2DLQ7_LYSEN|nr:translation initiation factor IF-2-like protein [Lysobacter enzymogenes]